MSWRESSDNDVWAPRRQSVYCWTWEDNMERGREQDYAAFNAWKYRHYFELNPVKGDKNISVRCTLCVGIKLLSTAKNSTSNLSKHLASRHRNVKLTENIPEPPADMTAAAPSHTRSREIWCKTTDYISVFHGLYAVVDKLTWPLRLHLTFTRNLM